MEYHPHTQDCCRTFRSESWQDEAIQCWSTGMGTPLLLRFHVRNRKYLTAVGGTPCISHATSAWATLLGTPTVVSSSTQGSSDFANQGSATVQSSLTGTVTSSLISSGDMQSSPASSTPMSAPAADGGAQDTSTKTASAATIFDTTSSASQDIVLAPDPYEEAATLPAAPVLTGIASDAGTGSATATAPVTSSSTLDTASLRLQASIASLTVEPSQDASADTTAVSALAAPAAAPA